MEKPWRHERYQRRRKTPSFSSSLLESIYHSIDEAEQTEKKKKLVEKRRNDINGNGGGVGVEEEITSLRRAIMLEKWIENYDTRSFHRFYSAESSSETESSTLFSCSETESRTTTTTPRSFSEANHRTNERQFVSTCGFSGRRTAHQAWTGPYIPSSNPPPHVIECDYQKSERQFMTRTKSRALKIYGDLNKKVKQPISPGGKIASFLNSIFSSSKNMKKHEDHRPEFDWRKSRSVKDSTFTTRSCLNKTPNNNNKSKRSVRFCPVSVILNEDSQPCGHKITYQNENTKNQRDYINISFGDSEVKSMKNQRSFRGIYDDDDENCSSDDDMSCTSSDLFELENVGSFNRDDANAGDDDYELPVYGTTSLKINQAIANGFIL